MTVQVLVTGAGPTGLVLALWLAHLGIRVRIIDKAPEPGIALDGDGLGCRSDGRPDKSEPLVSSRSWQRATPAHSGRSSARCRSGIAARSGAFAVGRRSVLEQRSRPPRLPYRCT